MRDLVPGTHGKEGLSLTAWGFAVFPARVAMSFPVRLRLYDKKCGFEISCGAHGGEGLTGTAWSFIISVPVCRYLRKYVFPGLQCRAVRDAAGDGFGSGERPRTPPHPGRRASSP